MARTERGARPLAAGDWPFGAVGRRLFLRAILLEKQPATGWTKSALEKRVGVERGGVDRFLDGASSLELVKRDGSRWRRVDPPPEIASPITKLVKLAEELSDRPIKPTRKRKYAKRSCPPDASP